MKLLKYVLGGLAVTAAVGVGVVAYKWWKGRKQNDVDDYDEENNHPELRDGVYENPIDGPSWRLEPGEYYNPE
ncbi:hypothetical protein ABFA07_021182 [Porites harrisoni]